MERGWSRFESGSVTGDLVRQRLSDAESTIEASVLRFKDYPDYRVEDTERVLSLLKRRIQIFSEGLQPADDYSALYDIIEHRLGLAEALSYKPKKILDSAEILEAALDAVQRNMIVNKLLSDEAILALKQSDEPEKN